MKRSVYSLVLMDEVVQAVDAMAYARNTSRSNLINQILAEYTACITPEQRMKDIFGRLEEKMLDETSMQVQAQPSSAMLSIRSALQYKYRPTIRYSVELYREQTHTIGQLKVSFRTQSRTLIDMLNGFFDQWVVLEQQYIARFFPDKRIAYQLEDGKLIRQFILPKEANLQKDAQLGEAIAQYIQLFDQLIKIYFAYDNQPQEANRQMQKAYQSYLNEAITVI